MEKIKEYYRQNERKIRAAVAALIIFSLGFGLGYLTAKDTDRAPIIIEKYSIMEK